MRIFTLFLLGILATLTAQGASTLRLSSAAYEDRVRAAWLAQMAGALMGMPFEHRTAAVAWVDRIPERHKVVPVDDDWYYEMVAVRAFEKYGIGMTVSQLGEQWKENSAGSWGSSEQARLLLARGVTPPETGHPRYNRLWFSIGPQFSAEVYGLLAPGMPNLAGKLAREYGHINGYAEGVDGAVFMAGMVSVAFVESDSRTIVKQAANLIHPSSPYRQCLDMVIAMAEKGASAAEVAGAVEDRWHIEYPATNNAVANGGLVALSVWFGEGDFLQTVNHAFRAGDYTDADCNAANAAAVVGAMHGMKALPEEIVQRLGDRIVSAEMGGVKLTPPVDESIAELAQRTAAIGKKFVTANGGNLDEDAIAIATQEVRTQPAEPFHVADLMRYWNPEWTLLRAGVGGGGGGMRLRGATYLEGETLATYPRDEVRGVVLTRKAKIGADSVLTFEAGAEGGCAWGLEVYVDNERVLARTVEAKARERDWQTVEIPLKKFAGNHVTLRLYQRILFDKVAGTAFWRNLALQSR